VFVFASWVHYCRRRISITAVAVRATSRDFVVIESIAGP
jgi:hypothetical protein